jgi:ABC-2 type transport system permease protein
MELQKLWAVISREYLERVRTRWFVLATVFGPVVFGTLMYLPAYMATRSRASVDATRIRILDATGTDLGRRVATAINGGLFGDTTRTRIENVAPEQLAAAESTATRAVIARQIKGYLVLERSVLLGKNPRYAGSNATSIPDMRRIEVAVNREVLAQQMRALGIAPAEAERLKRVSLDLIAERITPTGRGGSGQVSIIIAISVAFLLYITIFIYGQNVLRGVIEEKQTRVAEIVVSSVRPTTLLAGKVLGVGAVGLTQMMIWSVASILMAKYRVALLQQFGASANPILLPSISWQHTVLLILFFLLGYTFYAALFAAIGATVSSEQEAQQAQMPVVLLLVISIMFLQPVLNNPDGALALNLGWLPFSSPIVMPLRMSAVNVSVWEIALSLFALTAGCYIAVYVAARVYRTGLLMYGKRPSFREIMRWVRESH